MRAVLAFLSVVFMLAASGEARGQASADVEAVQNRISQLERQLRAVQRKVFNNPDLAPDAAMPQTGAAGGGSLLADMSVKIGVIERQLRELTGRLEELEYGQRQNAEALEALRREVELRFASGVQPLPRAEGAPQAAAGNPPQVMPGGGEPLSDALPPADPSAAAVALPDGTPAARFDYAFAFVRGNDLARGREAFELFLEAHPADEITPNAIFWLGRIHLREGRDALAAQQFLTLIDKHPGHAKRADALVDLAEVLIKLDSASDACDALAEFGKVSAGVSPRLTSRADRLGAEAQCRR